MCVEGWNRKRWNPAGIRIKTIEVCGYLFPYAMADGVFVVATSSCCNHTPRRSKYERPRWYFRLDWAERNHSQGCSRSWRWDPGPVCVQCSRILQENKMGLKSGFRDNLYSAAFLLYTPRIYLCVNGINLATIIVDEQMNEHFNHYYRLFLFFR